MVYHVARSGNSLPTFWVNLSVPFSRDTSLNMGPIGCHETSARNDRYSLRNNPEERSSQTVTSVKCENVQTGAFHRKNSN